MGDGIVPGPRSYVPTPQSLQSAASAVALHPSTLDNRYSRPPRRSHLSRGSSQRLVTSSTSLPVACAQAGLSRSDLRSALVRIFLAVAVKISESQRKRLTTRRRQYPHYPPTAASRFLNTLLRIIAGFIESLSTSPAHFLTNHYTSCRLEHRAYGKPLTGRRYTTDCLRYASSPMSR